MESKAVDPKDVTAGWWLVRWDVGRLDLVLVEAGAGRKNALAAKSVYEAGLLVYTAGIEECALVTQEIPKRGLVFLKKLDLEQIARMP